jgi:hypothetical protein
MPIDLPNHVPFRLTISDHPSSLKALSIWSVVVFRAKRVTKILSPAHNSYPEPDLSRCQYSVQLTSCALQLAVTHVPLVAQSHDKALSIRVGRSIQIRQETM